MSSKARTLLIIVIVAVVVIGGGITIGLLTSNQQAGTAVGVISGGPGPVSSQPALSLDRPNKTENGQYPPPQGSSVVPYWLEVDIVNASRSMNAIVQPGELVIVDDFDEEVFSSITNVINQSNQADITCSERTLDGNRILECTNSNSFTIGANGYSDIDVWYDANLRADDSLRNGVTNEACFNIRGAEECLSFSLPAVPQLR